MSDLVNNEYLAADDSGASTASSLNQFFKKEAVGKREKNRSSSSSPSSSSPSSSSSSSSSSPHEQRKFEPLEVMRLSMQALIWSAKQLRVQLDQDSAPLSQIFSLLKEAKKEKTRIHITGIGRSLMVGRVFGEMLQEKGYEVSVIGRDYAKPVRNGDLVWALSGSGTTRSTISNVLECITMDVKVIGITASPRSALARLSDVSVVLDWTARAPLEEDNYVRSQIRGKRVPLTPMGTMFELTALLFLVAITEALTNETPIAAFQAITERVITEVDHIWERITHSKGLTSAVLDLKHSIIRALQNHSSVFCTGIHTARLIATMIGMRIQHLGIDVRPASAWRYRRPNDLLIYFSRQGDDELATSFIRNAKETGVHVVSLTQIPNSPIAQQSHQSIYLVADVSSALPSRYLPASFEWAAAIILDALIAEVAYDLEIEEPEMILRHANIQ